MGRIVSASVATGRGRPERAPSDAPCRDQAPLLQALDGPAASPSRGRFWLDVLRANARRMGSATDMTAMLVGPRTRRQAAT